MQVINKRLIDLISLIFLDFGIYLYIIYKVWIIEKYEYNNLTTFLKVLSCFFHILARK